MLDHLVGILHRVHGIGPSLVERGVPIGGLESIFNDGTHGRVSRDIGETHVFTIPVKFLVQWLESHGQYSHHHHLVEWTGFGERRSRLYAIRGRFLTGTHPVHLVRKGHFTLRLW